MAHREHLERLKQGVEAWNAWRREHPSIRPDLSGAYLAGANLREINFTYADLAGANLRRASLYHANLSYADLTDANLMGADLAGANLQGVSLTLTDIRGTNLRHSIFERRSLIPSSE